MYSNLMRQTRSLNYNMLYKLILFTKLVIVLNKIFIGI